ncbi:MAG TPA: DNA adenine methylase [Spirochaetales bacterium]|nr:DNA adenine methylase [Spirochaetales bacterium]
MAKSLSPLRYPGGKSKIYDKVKKLIEANALGDRTYVEPFAGGFGIGIGLLCDDIIQSAVLNDFDSHIYNFWHSVFHRTEALLKRITDTPITLEEREKQKAVYKDCSADELSDGFATLFLNRVNFSGVIMGGPIGGLSQDGAYKIDCRFNKSEIVKKIERIALLKDRIELYNCDASELITVHLQDMICTSFFNIDPPYVKKGKKLYANYFKEEDHKSLARIIAEHLGETRWIVTYDDCDLIRDIYKQYHMTEYSIQHDVGGSVRGKEIVITNIPEGLFVW